MKKITALILAFVMVLSMIPAMALLSSAEVTTLITGPSVFHTGGTETWRAAAADGTHGDRIVTQFLIGYQPPSNNGLSLETIGQQVGYVAGKWDGATWIPATCTNGHFELTVTDLDGVVTKFKDITPGTLYTNGTDNHIFRMEVNEAKGDKEFTIQRGNTYTLQLDIYVGDTLTYTTESSGYTWTAGSNAWEKEIYKNGEVVQSVYVPEVDPYEEPFEIPFYHSGFVLGNGSDFEAHASFGKNMLIAVPQDKILSADDMSDAYVRITLGEQVIETRVSSTVGNYPGYDDTNTSTNIACTQYRITVDPFPAAGEYPNAKIEFLRAGDKKLMYYGTMNIFSTGNTDLNYDPDNYPRKATLTSYTGSDEEGNKLSDWKKISGTEYLHVVVGNLFSDGDLSFSVTTIEVLFDGKEVAYPSYLYPNTSLGEQEDGTYSVLMRWDLWNTTITEGEHTFQITIKYDGSIMYTSDPLTVTYSTSGTLGDFDGDGKVTANDRNYLARAIAKWEGYEI